MPNRRLPDWITLNKNTESLYDVLNDAPDLICGIVGAAYIDAQLVAILAQKLIEGSTSERLLQRGALAEFFARASLLYCMGAIAKPMFQNLERIVNIRNRFAHEHLELDFEDPEIASLANELTIVGPDPADAPQLVRDWFNEQLIIPRNAFVVAVLQTVGLLNEHLRPKDSTT